MTDKERLKSTIKDLSNSYIDVALEQLPDEVCSYLVKAEKFWKVMAEDIGKEMRNL